MHMRIYKPSKTAMQSGRAGIGLWRVEPAPTPKWPDPLMGWTSAGDTGSEVRLSFSSLEAARAFAAKQGWTTEVEKPNERRVVPRVYGVKDATAP